MRCRTVHCRTVRCQTGHCRIVRRRIIRCLIVPLPDIYYTVSFRTTHFKPIALNSTQYDAAVLNSFQTSEARQHIHTLSNHVKGVSSPFQPNSYALQLNRPQLTRPDAVQSDFAATELIDEASWAMEDPEIEWTVYHTSWNGRSRNRQFSI